MFCSKMNKSPSNFNNIMHLTGVLVDKKNDLKQYNMYSIESADSGLLQINVLYMSNSLK